MVPPLEVRPDAGRGWYVVEFLNDEGAERLLGGFRDLASAEAYVAEAVLAHDPGHGGDGVWW